MVVLGISAFYHDSAAAILVDGDIVAAAQEERFTREKHDSSFPHEAIAYCLGEANLKLENVDHIVFYDKPFLKFERLLETYLAFAPRGIKSFSKSLPVWIKEKLFQKENLIKELSFEFGDPNISKKLLFSEHHQSHAASAFYPSPFEEAIVLTLDGVGEWATTSISIGKGNQLTTLKEIHFPHSLGLLYSAFTYYIGFKVNSGEYKVMGLAPYGEPKYTDLILEKLIDVKEDGSFRLDMKYFDYCTDLKMTSKYFHKLFGGPPRRPEEDPLTQKHMDLAASLQEVIEIILLKMTQSLAKEYQIRNLCLAGGVALNCVANGKIFRSGNFDSLWVQPAAGDAGGALGAALAAYYQHLQRERVISPKDSMKGSYLGPQFSNQFIEEELRSLGAKFQRLSSEELVEKTALALSQGSAVGWFQSRMEFGPRALGARSILADPRSETMQKNLNLKVKFRESFRPFAPAVLGEKVGDWFNHNGPSPYMLLVAEIKKEHQKKMSPEEEQLFGIEKLNIPRSNLPAITHVDYSARIQTVHMETNPLFHKLLESFEEKTGVPVLVNTSFNVRGEPIVNTPKDAYLCFMGTDLDILSIGDFFLKKEEQNPDLLKSYKDKYQLD